MSPKVLRTRQADSVTVRVDLNSRGVWEVAIADQEERIVCRSLDEARTVASQCAARRRPCELIVCDAYHRVLRREHVNGQSGAQHD